MKKNELLQDSDVRLLSKNLPRQTDFVSLVQNFGQAKVMPGNFRLPQDNYRLIPFGGELYGLYFTPKYKTFDEFGHLNTTFEGERHELGTPEMIVRFNKQEYLLAKDKHKSYWDWKKNRNVSRGELEERFGYDTKHAMHLVRLLRMGVEALRDGEIIVKRPDAEELLSIRNGAWTYEEIVEYAEMMDNEVCDVWYKKTNLPKKANLKKVANMLMDVQDLVWENR